MDKYLKYNTSNGTVVPDTTTLVQDTWEDYKAIFGQDLSDEEASPQGRLVEVDALAKKFAIGLSALTINQINPNYAGGVFLDAIASLFNIERHPAEVTIVYCNMFGVPGTIIPAGTKVFDSNGNVFITHELYKLAKEAVLVRFYCTEPGEIYVPADSITVPPNIPGVEGIVQQERGVTGRSAESDASLLSRLNLERYTGIGVFGNISSSLNKLDFIKTFKVYNNGSNIPKTLEGGVTINAHSVLIIIDYDDSEQASERNKLIAEAIINNITAGCGYTSISSSITVDINYGGVNYVTTPVIFNKAEKIEAFAKVTVEEASYSGTDLEKSIKDFLVRWSKNEYKSLYPNEIGAKLSSFYIASAMKDVLGCVVTDLKIGTSQNPSSVSINLPANKISYFSEENITVIKP